MLENLEREDFAARLNDKFNVEFEAGQMTEVELVEVSDLIETEVNRSYSMVFLAPIDTPAKTDTFKIQNEKMGELELFLSPFYSDEKGVKFEAIFNHLVD